MSRPRKPPSQTWRTFLENHVKEIAAIDFFTVPTVTFRVLYCFVVLRHERRRVVHFNVTASPTAGFHGDRDDSGWDCWLGVPNGTTFVPPRTGARAVILRGWTSR